MSERNLASAGGRKTPHILRSHEDIYDLGLEANRKADDAIHRTDLLAHTLQRVETKVDDLMTILGHGGEDEQGHPIGTGLVGTVSRLSKHVGVRFKLYDRWISLATGFVVAFIPLGGVIWWLISGRLDSLLRAH